MSRIGNYVGRLFGVEQTATRTKPEEAYVLENPTRQQIKDATMPEYKPQGSPRFDGGKNKKSNRNRFSHNAKVKRRKAK